MDYDKDGPWMAIEDIPRVWPSALPFRNSEFDKQVLLNMMRQTMLYDQTHIVTNGDTLTFSYTYST